MAQRGNNRTCEAGDQSVSQFFFNQRHVRAFVGRILALSAGYNLKAEVPRGRSAMARGEVGTAACLHHLNLSAASDLHVVHWSGVRKPHSITAAQCHDDLERSAHSQYTSRYQAFYSS